MGGKAEETGKGQSPWGPEGHRTKLRFYVKCNGKTLGGSALEREREPDLEWVRRNPETTIPIGREASSKWYRWREADRSRRASRVPGWTAWRARRVREELKVTHALGL